jgi:thiol-disulfide isomerase/thioredoxin
MNVAVLTTIMICVAAAIVFGVLAIFSAKYRSLAKEAWSCVFRKVTLRPCQSGLDRRVRMKTTMAFAKRSPALGRAVHKAFPAVSFLFVALTIVSFGYVLYGGVNYALYGNCNGPGSTGFCVFDPNGPGSSELAECSEVPHTPETIRIPSPEELSNFKVLNPAGTKTIVFIGCYSCPYTREGAPALLDFANENPAVRIVLVDFPLAQHANATLAANAANCAYDETGSAFIPYARELYAVNLSNGLPASTSPAVAACAQTEHARVTSGIALGKDMGVYGTPTYIIGSNAYVGPLNERSLRKLVRNAPVDSVHASP